MEVWVQIRVPTKFKGVVHHIIIHFPSLAGWPDKTCDVEMGIKHHSFIHSLGNGSGEDMTSWNASDSVTFSIQTSTASTPDYINIKQIVNSIFE